MGMSRAPEAGSPAPIKAVVFDLWYTLVYIEGEHEKHERENTAIQAFFREARMDVPLARYRLQMAEVMNLRAWEPPEEGYRELARRVRVPPDRLPAFLAIMKDKYEGAVHA
ncbi:MAG: hypothetical protein HY520_00295, partial [Candidatus Aenigmarchaeota archaeon]|nr:hypothetical protein [Candidatus Aenigmarchaeota archaeon]